MTSKGKGKLKSHMELMFLLYINHSTKKISFGNLSSLSKGEGGSVVPMNSLKAAGIDLFSFAQNTPDFFE